jgi:hypothetical protein
LVNRNQANTFTPRPGFMLKCSCKGDWIVKRELVCLVIGFVALADSAMAQLPGRMRDQDAARHGWLFNLAEARDQARKTGKPIMAVVRCVP